MTTGTSIAKAGRDRHGDDDQPDEAPRHDIDAVVCSGYGAGGYSGRSRPRT